MTDDKKIQRLERKIERLKRVNTSLRKKNLELALKRKKEKLAETIDMEMHITKKVGDETSKVADVMTERYGAALNNLNQEVDDQLKNNPMLGDIAVMQVLNQSIKTILTEVLKDVLCDN